MICHKFRKCSVFLQEPFAIVQVNLGSAMRISCWCPWLKPVHRPCDFMYLGLAHYQFPALGIVNMHFVYHAAFSVSFPSLDLKKYVYKLNTPAVLFILGWNHRLGHTAFPHIGSLCSDIGEFLRSSKITRESIWHYSLHDYSLSANCVWSTELRILALWSRTGRFHSKTGLWEKVWIEFLGEAWVSLPSFCPKINSAELRETNFHNLK